MFVVSAEPKKKMRPIEAIKAFFDTPNRRVEMKELKDLKAKGPDELRELAELCCAALGVGLDTTPV